MNEVRAGRDIPLVDLRAQYLQLKDEIDRAVADVMSTGDFILGRADALCDAMAHPA